MRKLCIMAKSVQLLVATAIVSVLGSEASSIDSNVLWYAPFLAGGGYSSEAISFATDLVDRLPSPQFGIVQFAEQMDAPFYDGLEEFTRTQLEKGLRIGSMIRNSRMSVVSICHSTPDVWVPSAFAGWDETAPCPPPESKYKIGRTMYETDRVPHGWVERCNKMDEIWVPTEFHVEAFKKGGVDPNKLVVVPESVDVDFFNPVNFDSELYPGSNEEDFKFLSIFKWEKRKGWDILLKAYFEEFTKQDKVFLCIKTAPFYMDGKSSIREIINDYANNTLGLKPETLPRFTVIDSSIPSDLFPILYASAGAFVLPHRGEGWGRPHAEAMAMGLPVLATNWSGNTAFMDDRNSYPIKVDRLSLVNPDAPQTIKDVDGVEVANPDAGMKWAEASVSDLREKMRHVVNHQNEAFKKGYQARKDMVNRFSPEAVGKLVVKELERIEQNMRIHEEL